MDACHKQCEFGKVKSRKGCEICECSYPCQDIKCSVAEKCIVQNLTATCVIGN